MTELEYLNFDGCKGLQLLPHHITKQAFLRELHLGGSFSELPSSIGQLERLEMLRIGSSELESLPDSLGNLSSLTRLYICGCEKVRSLPESLGRLALLESIILSATGVESLPKAFGHLISLQTLQISSSPMRELIFDFEESPSLPTLKSIYLEGTRMSTISIPRDFYPSLETLRVSRDYCLVEIKTLPRTVKTITLMDCKRLKDIVGVRSVQNLQYLAIWRCPELVELPSFAEFAYMKEIKIMGCQISGKMEGLERLTSLESLEVHTQWEVSGITSLERAQELRRLVLSAPKIGALEPSIKTLQKLPGEVSILGRALGCVESVVKAFTSSNLFVVEACAHGNDGDDGAYRNMSVQWREWRLGDLKTCLSCEPTIVCYVINCLSRDNAEASVWEGGCDRGFDIKLSEGKWVWLCAFSQGIIDGKGRRDLEIRFKTRKYGGEAAFREGRRERSQRSL